MSKRPEFLCGALPSAPVRPLPPFSQAATDFLSALSGLLLRDKEAKAYPDVVTFAFFCRRANLESLREEYDGQIGDRLGRGLAFHIAPSNVPVNFAYSLAASLLAGNGNVVKASSKGFAQTNLICRAIGELLSGEFAALSSYVCVLTYPREEQGLTEELSALCDARIIWGGDETVRRVRQAALAPRAFDIAFADRYSLLVADASAVLAMDGKRLAAAAQGFYNDTYLTDQNACTAPRLVYWLGSEKEAEAAGERFWSAVRAYAAPRYALQPVVAVDKLTAACRAAMDLPGVTFAPSNLITRVRLERLSAGMEEYRSPGGFFLEYASQTLDDLKAVVTPRYQTLSVLGAEPEAVRRFVLENGLRGVDRVVPIGHTMDFALTWDGFDWIRTLSRRVGIS